MGHGEQGKDGGRGDADRHAMRPRLEMPKQGRWMVIQGLMLVLNASLAGLAWRDHDSIRASIAFAGVIVASLALGNLLSTNLWIGLVDDLLRMGASQMELTDQLIKKLNEPRA